MNLRDHFGAGFSAAPIRSVMPTLRDGAALPFVLAPHDQDGAPTPPAGAGVDPVPSGESPLERKIGELLALMKQQGETREQENPAADGKARDGGRYAAALDGSKATADELAELHKLRAEKAEAAEKARLREVVLDVMGQRGPSKAGALGDGSAARGAAARARFQQKASPIQELAFGEGYVPGEAVSAIAMYTGRFGLDPELIAAGKAKLAELGMDWMGAEGLMSTGLTAGAKATLGTTGATGGYVLPNNLVEGVVKPKTQAAIYRRLVTVVPGVMVRGVDQPYRLGAPTRMTTADWGATKTNVNESYGSYTANLVTFASIYDVAKQYLRFSAGSAERDILDELAKAAELAENYAVIAGPGTGTVGSGDATLGIYTSLNATPTWIGYKGAKTNAASSSTILGSFAQACVEITSLLAARNRQPEAIVVDSTTYFTALGQGTDTAGFWVAPDGPAQGFSVDRLTGGISYFGVPVYYDTNLGANAATKIAIAAEWSAFKLYRGMEFRIDSSDVAGERWDKNLVGFRGEMELGFNAETPVHVGAAQLMTSVIP